MTVWMVRAGKRGEREDLALEEGLSLRDKDRFLWAKSVLDQLQSDVNGAFA